MDRQVSKKSRHVAQAPTLERQDTQCTQGIIPKRVQTLEPLPPKSQKVIKISNMLVGCGHYRDYRFIHLQVPRGPHNARG